MDPVPPDMAMNKDLCQELNGAFVTSTNTLQAANAVTDTRLKQALAKMPDLQSKLMSSVSSTLDRSDFGSFWMVICPSKPGVPPAIGTFGAVFDV
jgi:hypothetical protein